MIKFFFRVIIGLIVFIVAFWFIFLSDRQIDLKNDEAIKKWIGKEFQVKEGVFLYKCSDSKKLNIDIPGRNSGIPASIEAYYEDTKAWPSRDRNSHKTGQRGSTHFSWIEPLVGGTHLRISRIYRFIRPAVGDILIIEVEILDGPCKGYYAGAEYLFHYEDISECKIFGPKEEILFALN